MDTTEKLKKLWKQGITKDGWGYDILEADLDGILKLTSEWIDKNFIPVEAQVSLPECGYYGIGILNGKTEMNIGTLWRSASILGASFIFTIGKRYKKQASDTMKAWRHIPLYHYDEFADFYKNIPYDCQLVGVELDERAHLIKNYVHPQRCIYILGAEDNGLTIEALSHCHSIIQLPGEYCMNVAVAGSIVMYDRYNKRRSN